MTERELSLEELTIDSRDFSTEKSSQTKKQPLLTVDKLYQFKSFLEVEKDLIDDLVFTPSLSS